MIFSYAPCDSDSVGLVVNDNHYHLIILYSNYSYLSSVFSEVLKIFSEVFSRNAFWEKVVGFTLRFFVLIVEIGCLDPHNKMAAGASPNLQ